MILVLAVLAALTLGSAAVAFALRNLIHSALLLIFAWAGVAGFYLWAGAEFVAFAQLLIYVGAISMVVLFAVLLTRRSIAEPAVEPASWRRTISAVLAGGAVAGVLAGAVLSTDFAASPERIPSVNVRQLGLQLIGPHAASLLVAGVILTVALIGATILASVERDEKSAEKSRGGNTAEDRP
jgi:NADH:ubiquinone oxidoreductase subunit 6 (subunit J)